MNITNFIYNKLLQGYKIMGINQKKIDREAILKAWKQKYTDYVKSLDLKPLQEYIDIGMKAQVFRDIRTLEILKDKDDIMFGFPKDGYLYTFRRQPLNIPPPQPQIDLNNVKVETFAKAGNPNVNGLRISKKE